MNFRVTLVILVSTVVVTGVHAQPTSKPRLDALGDLLPGGAIARLGTLRFKHAPAGDPTIDVALFSPTGNKVASLVYGRGSVCLFDAVSGKEVRGPWNSANKRFAAIAFSADGALLAAAVDSGPGPGNGSSQREVILYDITAVKIVKTFTGPKHSVRALDFADGGKTLVIAGDGMVSWWDMATGKEQRSWKAFDEKRPSPHGGDKIKTFNNCVMAPNAESIAVHVAWRDEKAAQGGGPKDAEPIDQEAIGFDLATSKISWRSHGKKAPDGRSRFAFSADGRRVAIAMGKDQVEVRNALTGKLVATPLDTRLDGPFLGGLALSSDGRMAAMAGSDSNVILWSPDDTAAPRKFVARIAQYWDASTSGLHFSPDNKTLLVGVDADLQLYDVASLKEIRPCEGHRGWIDYLAFAHDGRRLLTGSANLGLHSQELAAWDVATWKQLQLTSVKTSPWPNVGVVSPEQTVFVGKTGADRFGLYDMTNGKLLSRFLTASKQQPQSRGFFSPSGKFYILAGQDEAGKDIERVYKVPSGKLVCQMPALAMGQGAMESARPVGFTPDERLVAFFARDDGLIHVLDTATGQERHRLGEKINLNERKGQFVANMAFARDGKLLASWRMGENVIRVWDVHEGKELLQVLPTETRTENIGGPGMDRVHFAWSPDSRLLAVGQSKIRLWELATVSVRREYAGHQDGSVRALDFSPNGNLLASGSSNTTVLIWDVGDLGPAPTVALGRGELAERWQALAEANAAKALPAIRDLIAAPEASVAWIKDQIKPVGPIDIKRVDDLIGLLNHNQFKIRQKAMTELLRIGERSVPAFDKALAGNPALETHLRLQDLRKRMTGLVLQGDRLQAFRAVEVLEKIGTPQARQVLAELGDGAAGALVTTQARQALERLKSQ